MATTSSRRANRLAQETSPYLLSHAENPVDWYPWGPEALERARREDRPILLSIGYAACHWCHVMERESFQNEAIAELMNQHFVCVKVDREERPDLDDIYMAATVALSGSGGWPMTVFLTPEQRPFFAGTYFPPEDRYGRPGFPRLLQRVAEAWAGERSSLTQQADALTEHVRRQSRLSEPLSVGRDAMAAACEALWQSFDREFGGFGGAPKFPPAATLSFLLRHYRQSADLRALEMVVGTLNGMKNGGIYDHVGGGFARYSTDARWLVPHFEKMLYDNAQLAQVYAEAYQVTGRSEYGRVVTETLDYVSREMQGPDGGYFSATDADSEGEEGKFFVWTWDQLAELLDPQDAERFCAFYDITPEGNWEGKSVLNTPRSLAQVAADLGIAPAELAATLERARPLVYQARQRRVPPLLDDKVLTAHNGLMIGAMAFASQVCGEPAYLRSATRAADYAWRTLRRPDQGLYRTARGGTAHLNGYLEDYAYLCNGLLTLYEAGGDPVVLQNALALGERMMADFGDAQSGAFFHTAHDHEQLIARTREGHDGALPNPNSVAACALLRLGRHFGRELLVERARAALRAYGREIARLPRAFVSALSVIDMALEAPLELVTVGALEDPRTLALNAVIASSYLPNKVQAHVDPGRADTQELSPLTRDKPLLAGAPAVYVCENFSCRTPTSDPERLRQELDSALQARRERRGRELSQTTLGGAATPAATRRFATTAGAASRALGAADYSELADTGILVSRVGFGAYRLTASEAHAEALRFAIQQGVNLIDTAGSYTDGDSERVIGQTLLGLRERGVVAREELVVVTKLGDVRGATLADCRFREQQGRPLPEVVKHKSELWHCVHPEFLEEELERSLERLGLASLDVCLLQNPEYYLEAGASEDMPLTERRTELYRRIEQAFGFFERAGSAGKLQYYGVSSNTLGRAAEDPRALDAARLLAAAERAAGTGNPHRFRVLELPLNLLEPAAAVLKNTGDAAQVSVLEFARQRQLALLTNRPLSAWTGGALERLIDPDVSAEAPPVEAALSKVAELEAQFRRQFAAQLRVPEGAPPADSLFRWAERLRKVASELQSLAQLEELGRVVLEPQIDQALSSLDRAFGASHTGWAGWRGQYLTAMQALLDALRRRAAERTARTLEGLRQGLAPYWTGDLQGRPTSQLAVAAVSQLPGVTSVLVGMRQREYVEAALHGLRIPPASDIRAAFEALFSQARGAPGKS